MSTLLQSHPFQLRSGADPDRTDTLKVTSSKPGPSRSSPRCRSPRSSRSRATPTPTSDSPPSESAHPRPTQLGSELFDAIVQSANPRHPQYAAWHDKYGSASSRSSRASGSSSQILDNIAASSSPATPSSHKSFDHSDPSNRRKHAARMARDGYSAYRQSNEAAGSDADDPMPTEGRFTPVRASFEGSVRSNCSSNVTSTSQRRRNRRLREGPKPLLPPVPPPRITSSTNWQSVQASASMYDLASSLPRTTAYHASSASTGDHRDRSCAQTQSRYLIASPSAPALLRMAHPYASTATLPKVHERDPAPPSSPLNAYGPHQPASAPAFSPENVTRSVNQKADSFARVAAPVLTSPELRTMAVDQSRDNLRQVDPSVFPVRRDDEFRNDDLEMSDGSEVERDPVQTQPPPSSFKQTSFVKDPAASRGPGKIRRSLDSVISPFRAGLLNSASSHNIRREPSSSSAKVAVSNEEPVALARRSFSDSRLLRPFLPRPRAATIGRLARPLSRVVDHPEEEFADFARPTDDRCDRNGQHDPSSVHTRDPTVVAVASESQPAVPTLASTQSTASIYGHTTSNLHGNSPLDAAAAPQQRSRGKFGGFMNKFRGSRLSKGSSSIPMRESGPQVWPTSQASYQDYRGASLVPAISASPSVVIASLPATTRQTAERGLRSRVKSFTALSSSRSKNDGADVPAVPAVPAHFAAPTEGSMTHSMWEESPRAPAVSTFASTASSLNFGKLLRRKKASDGAGKVVDRLPVSAPSTSFSKPMVEAVPRSSMSSARGFDLEEAAGTSASVAQSRVTIRKTLSPALLRDMPQPSIDAAFGAAQPLSPDRPALHSNNDSNTDIVTAVSRATGRDQTEETLGGAVDQLAQPLRVRRPPRATSRVDRLSRVEELSERLSYIAEPKESTQSQDSAFASHDSPSSHYPRSFGEHRFQHNSSSSGNHREQTLPQRLDLAATEGERPQEASSSVQRAVANEGQSGVSDDDGMEWVASTSSAGLKPSIEGRSDSAPKTPTTPSLVSQLTPTWRSTSFSAPASGRTSFSQDRDRAPVASPISPPLPAKRSVAQAIKSLGTKNKTKKGGKGIGPNDVIVLDLDHDQDEGDLSQEMSSRPSISVESRSSFGGGARPSFSALARPSFNAARPSLDATRSNTLMAAELATMQLEAEAIAMMQSPFIASSGSEGLSHQATNASSLRPLAGSIGKTSEPAGLGLDAGQLPDTIASRKSESMDISGSTSEGTFTTQGIQTPDNMSLSHSYMSQVPSRSDWATGATTPLAGRASFDTGSQMTVALKSPEQLAFEDMLGRFPQQQKSLLQDISARVGKTPVLGSAGWTSREDL